MLDDADIDRVREAVAAYFRAAGALAEASVLGRVAAQTASAVPDDGVDESGQAWLLDRAETYRDKAEHMSRSGTVLLSHAWDWINELDDAEIPDIDQVMEAFARAIEDAALAYAGVIDALTATPLGDHPAYQELLQELRHAARFLQTEAAELDDSGADIL